MKKLKNPDIEKTFAEIEEKKYKRLRPIRISKPIMFAMLFSFAFFLLISTFEISFYHSKLSAEDGAGTYWTCGNCGSSNKCYELSCSNCGSWR